LFDRVKAGLAAFVRGVHPRLDYLARYPGTVVAQAGPNSFDFQPDSPLVPGVSGVPVRFGLPGVVVQLVLEGKPRALLGFAGGDPSAPFLDLWEQPGLDSLTVDPAATVNLGPAAAPVGRVGDQVQVVITAGSLTLAVSGGSATGPASDTAVTGTITAGSPLVNA
jgi:hypothetical protein